MNLTTQERRDLIAYGYQQLDRAGRCRAIKSINTHRAEALRAWALAGYTTH